MAGQVFVNGQKAAKASDTVKPIDELTVAGSEKYEPRRAQLDALGWC